MPAPWMRSANYPRCGRVPGHREWHLAPREMAWEGKTAAEICEQIKDPARNGGRKIEDLIDHIGKDTLVGRAWPPGFGRSAAPGTHQKPEPSSRPGQRAERPAPSDGIAKRPSRLEANRKTSRKLRLVSTNTEQRDV